MHKKKFIFMAIALISITLSTSWILISCDESNETINYEQKQSFDNLIKELDDMNEEFMLSENITNKTTRGWFSKFFKAVCADVAAIWYEINHNVDIKGPKVYTTKVSSASCAAYYELVPDSYQYYNYTYQQKEMFDSLKMSYAYIPENNNIAIAHNAVILEMIKDNLWKPANTVELVANNINTSKKIGVKVSDEPIQEIANSVDELIFNYDSNPPFRFETKPVPTNISDIPKFLIESYLYNIQNLTTPDQVSRYTSLYITSLYNPHNQIYQLPEEQKQKVIEVIRLANSSFDLWYHMSIIDGAY